VKKILALIDFSDTTSLVFKTAIEVARAFGAKLTLLHAATPDSDFEGSEMRRDFSRKGVAVSLRRQRRALRLMALECKASSVLATPMLVRSGSSRGTPKRKILQEVAHRKPDIIVVGSHGHGAVHRFILGSISAAVIRAADCPVLVVPGHRFRSSQSRPLSDGVLRRRAR
jgi:nucleotide-binding universal stress UspA family protein